jgi:hypothetical protein
MPALIPSLWFETVRLGGPDQVNRLSGGSVRPSRAVSIHPGFQSGTNEIGTAMRSAQIIRAARSAPAGDPLRTPQWQCVDEKELRR